MFVLSMKANRRKLLIAAAVVLTAVLITVLVVRSFQDGAKIVVTASGKEYTTAAEDNDQRTTFLEQFGWEVAEEPIEISEVTIPQTFNEVYEAYNEIQRSQGLDLAKYAGQICKRWVYEVTNYPGQEQNVHANLLILDGKVIGGDICSAELDGFMHGFDEFPETGTAVSSIPETEASSLPEPNVSEIPTAAWPTD